MQTDVSLQLCWTFVGSALTQRTRCNSYACNRLNYRCSSSYCSVAARLKLDHALVCFDLGTTGLNTKRDRIRNIAAVRYTCIMR